MTVYEGSNRVTSPFGKRILNGRTAMHNGIDIAKDKGSKQRACVAGTVAWTSTGYSYGRGKNLVIRKDTARGTVWVRHQHADSLLVKKGATVSPAMYVATEGTTGDVTGSHEHFEVVIGGALDNSTGEIVGGMAVDPSPWLGIPNAKGTYPQNDLVYNYGTGKHETENNTATTEEDDNMYRLYETTFASENIENAKKEFDKIAAAGGRPGMSFAASDGRYRVGTVLMAAQSPEALWQNMAPNRFIG